jgi:ribonucleoside-diphosphate reductase alpha chain
MRMASRRTIHLINQDQLAKLFFNEAGIMGISDRDRIEQAVSIYIRKCSLSGIEPSRYPQPDTNQIRVILKTVQETQERQPALSIDKMEKKMEKKMEIQDLNQPTTRTFTIKLISLSKNALTVLERRYLKKDKNGQVIETPEEMLSRVAQTIASAEPIYNSKADVKAREEEFYQLMANLEFLPNSPTLMNAGRELGQLSACFVLPVNDSMDSIFDAVKNTALIQKSGGGTGFSFSQLRPKGDFVKSTSGVASGPASFMKVFDITTEVTKQGGMRRGANMAILNVEHPDIMEFITAKENSTAFINFNLSVAVTDKFMKAVEKGTGYNLVNPRTGEMTDKLNAKEVFDKIVDMAWRTGDPGVVFIDEINRHNPTPKLGKIESTNPCGEQPLLPFESCNLGSINLSKMVADKDGQPYIDYGKLSQTIKLAVRFLDDVIDVNHFPLPEITEMTKTTRKIGLGVMGFADMLIQLGIPYDSEQGLAAAEEIAHFVSEEADKASIELAQKRVVFPAFQGSIYDVPDGPRFRNASRTTIAPTGSLSIIANCSSGIEPLFALSYVRHILEGEEFIEVNPYFEEAAKKGGFYSAELMRRLAEGKRLGDIEEVPEEMKRLFVTAHDISPRWHVKMQAVFQKSTDSAVSKTVNVPREATPEDVADVYMLAYRDGLKGITIYRDRSRESQVLTVGEGVKKAEGRLGPRKRPKVTRGVTERVNTGCGYIYVTVNFDQQGISEVFSTLGKAGGCAAAQLEAISRLTSVALRSGIDMDSIVKHLRGIRCPSITWEQGHAVLSCADAIASVLEKYIKKEGTAGNPETPSKNPEMVKTWAGQCPDCGGPLIYQEGCNICLACGFTKCG